MRILTGLVAAALAAVAALFGGWLAWGRDLPNVEDLDVLEYTGATRVYARDGQQVGVLTPNLGSGPRVNQTLLRKEQMSGALRAAVVTSEDRRFFEHRGLDLIGIARGVLRSATGDVEGGSSITQQTVKNTLLVDLEGARTPERKFKEALLAFQVERQFTKDEILTTYLNVIYWGSGGHRDIIGADAAAHAYFDKNARDLSLAESVYLATLIPSPGRYFDYRSYRPLMRSLLDRMVEDGRVTRLEADNAWHERLQPAGWRVRYDADGDVTSATLVDRTAKNLPPLPPRQHGHFLQTVERALVEQFGRKTVYGGTGLKVYTTMDLQAQQAAERASRDARLPDDATLGIALVQPSTGEVLALVGQKLDEAGRGGEWNNAVQSRRQVGSSVKPLLYTLALSKGWKQDDTVPDLPLEGDYQPKNYSGTYTGRPVTLRYALDHSLNLPTVRLAQKVGVAPFESKLRDLGLTLPDDGGLSLSIGTVEASPLQMAAAYATFANGGTYREPTVLRRVVGPGGQDLPLRKPTARRVWDEQTAYLGLDMIRGVVGDLGRGQGGLAWRARIPGWDVAGKTGTTNDVKDLWFVGVTPVVSGAVWVGKQEGGAMPQTAYSGEVAAPVWQQAVSGALAGRQAVAYRVPAGVTTRWTRGVNMAFREERAGAFGGLFRRGRDQAARDEAARQAEAQRQQDLPQQQEQAARGRRRRAGRAGDGGPTGGRTAGRRNRRRRSRPPAIRPRRRRRPVRPSSSVRPRSRRRRSRPRRSRLRVSRRHATRPPVRPRPSVSRTSSSNSNSNSRSSSRSRRSPTPSRSPRTCSPPRSPRRPRTTPRSRRTTTPPRKRPRTISFRPSRRPPRTPTGRTRRTTPSTTSTRPTPSAHPEAGSRQEARP
ncbi:transglycosylase domain-containing protein [Deinococcus pimensis]|uniref:transglycosylase domain-containing protein n=1 Tax=Deinococcus pimensis TaxID=309888 RepID=UPI001FDFF8EB|nr:transglycosylase domain-containing protein [Deinococcus pimensis]